MACLTGALGREGEEPVLLREERCIGCLTCTVFCPYGVIFPRKEEKVVVKCDRCLHMELPVCLDVCPTGALVLVDAEGQETLLEKKREQVACRTKFTGVKPVTLEKACRA
jgi:Fe-S-cluster-containing hydrogenase component 2